MLLEDAEDIAVMLVSIEQAVPSGCWAEEIIAAAQDAQINSGMAGI